MLTTRMYHSANPTGGVLARPSTCRLPLTRGKICSGVFPPVCETWAASDVAAVSSAGAEIGTVTVSYRGVEALWQCNRKALL